MVAAAELGRNEGGARILDGKVFGSTFKELRQSKFLAQVVGTMRDETLMTAEGPIPVTAFSTSAKEFLDCAADITRGLLANFYPEFDYHGHHFMVLDFHTATLAKGDASQQLKVIHEMTTKSKGDRRGNLDAFRFWRQVEPEKGQGAWLLVFYEAVAFSVIHARLPFGGHPRRLRPPVGWLMATARRTAQVGQSDLADRNVSNWGQMSRPKI